MMQFSDHSPEENAWPAFVDALTAVTMVLTFVMLILAIAVGTLSQKTSKGVLETFNEVARARGQKPITAQSTREDIKQAVESLQKPIAEPERPSAVLPADVKKIISRGIVDPPRATRAVESAVAASSVVLTYPKRQARLDADANKKLDDFLRLTPALKTAARIDILAVAPQSAGSLTEGRRVAYYRGMLLRARLINAGLAAGKIIFNVRDGLEGFNDDTVRLTVVPAAAH